MAERRMQEIDLSSGFTIGVTALPPYYMDMLNDNIPIPKYPMRKIALAGGAEVDWPYEPPEEAPTDDDADYELFVLWHDADRNIKEATNKRSTARVNYLLNMCIEIIEGPIDFDDTKSWAYKVEAAFPEFKVPENIGHRKLLFLKHFVLTTAEELNYVVTAATAPEVGMEGISSALRGFRHSLEEGGLGEDYLQEIQRELESLNEAMGSRSIATSEDDAG
jgi:hypothetical protein